MAKLNGAQFGQVLKNTLEKGGDSVNVVTGQRPTTGFMVSDENSETRVSAEGLDVDRITRHVDKHGAVLRGDPEAHLGTWRDARYSESGDMVPSPLDTVYLDVSRRYHAPLRAYMAGERENQKAIYDVAKDETIDILPTPHTHRAKRRANPHIERFL